MQDQKTSTLNLDRAVLATAGIFVLISVALGLLWTQWAFVFTAFIGLNMLQASITGFCPAAILYSFLGVKSGCAFHSKSGR